MTMIYNLVELLGCIKERFYSYVCLHQRMRGPGVIVYACNPICLRGRSKKITVWGQAGPKK
jgi:hypothetical protein